MLRRNIRIIWVVGILLFVSLLTSCATVNSDPLERTAAKYEAEGLKWGKKHWNWDGKNPLKPTETDSEFIKALINQNDLDFFWVHADLKDSFRKGYRLGYQDRTADLVLGPNITMAASQIGDFSAKKFIKDIDEFEKAWANTIKIFVTLISEGSQADRKEFIKQFTKVYLTKWEKTRNLIDDSGVSVKGSLLSIDYSKGEIYGILHIPSDEVLKTQIYHQTFEVMGDEWGRRLSTNLIKRTDLLDLLRKSRLALDEVTPGFVGNLSIVRTAFKKSYGSSDAENVFKNLEKDAGYNNN